ncbi:MAG: 3-keto-5-aminohexanoate cleavage protein, partial [Stellaceae bacterium]
MIACALTGAADTPGKNPAVPVSPKQIAESGIAAAKAGAAIVHIHVRNPQTTGPSMELAHYKEVVDRIRDSGVDVIINLTTGMGGRFIPSDDDPKIAAPGSSLSPPERRVEHIAALKPEIC